MWVGRGEAVVSSLKDQIKTGDLCDVLFYNRTGTVWAHSCVLAAFSPILSQMISLRLDNGNHWSIKQPMQINIDQLIDSQTGNDCLACLSKVVNFMYTGSIDLEPSHKAHLIALSQHFQNQLLFEVLERCRTFNVSSDSDTNITPGKNHLDNEKTFEELSSEENPRKRKSTDVCTVELINVSGPAKRKRPSIESELLYSSETAVCDKCFYLSDNAKLIDIHSKIFHNSNYYKCLNCKFQTRNVNQLVEHVIKLCHSRDNICSVCLFKCENLPALMSHIGSHQFAKPFECAFCREQFEKRNSWLKHVKMHFAKHSFSCSECELSFKTAEDRAKHCSREKAHKRHACTDCRFIAPHSYILEKHKLKHRKTLFACEWAECTFRTSSETMRSRHLSTHKTKNILFKDTECPVCKMKFTLYKNLKRHMRLHEAESSKLKCARCGYETLRKDKLREHCTNKHGDVKSALEVNGKVLEEFSDDVIHVEQEIVLNANGSLMEQGEIHGQQLGKGESEIFRAHKNRNTLMMDSKGDISIVNSDKNNSVTLRNIGNLTGSITLDEKTGILTMNNINSGSVFLNETTGELTYVNLEPQKENEKSDSADERSEESVSFEITKLDEFTGEIVRLPSDVEEKQVTEQEDTCDMDILNDDSMDGFDDFDELLFDVFNEETTYYKNEDVCQMPLPRLDESTGLLTFDDDQEQEPWKNEYKDGQGSRMDDEHAYQLLLDEVTGVLHD